MNEHDEMKNKYSQGLITEEEWKDYKASCIAKTMTANIARFALACRGLKFIDEKERCLPLDKS